jgi:hypothetical protein
MGKSVLSLGGPLGAMVCFQSLLLIHAPNPPRAMALPNQATGIMPGSRNHRPNYAVSQLCSFPIMQFPNYAVYLNQC